MQPLARTHWSPQLAQGSPTNRYLSRVSMQKSANDRFWRQIGRDADTAEPTRVTQPGHPQTTCSITASAMARSPSGASRPSIRVVCRLSDLEIGLIGYRHVVIEENLVVLRANELGQRPLTALIALVGLPGPIERVGILHRDIHFQRVAAVDQVPALRHMKLLGVRRAQGSDDSFGVEPDAVDDQRIAIVQTHRFAIV